MLYVTFKTQELKKKKTIYKQNVFMYNLTCTWRLW